MRFRYFFICALVVGLIAGATYSRAQLWQPMQVGTRGTGGSPPAAIAFVNSSIPSQTGNTGTVFTYSYATAINTNVMLVVGVWISPQITSDTQVSATYNGHACSDSGSTQDNQNSLDAIILEFCPLGATTDTAVHNLVITTAFSLSGGVIHVRVNEYSGAMQALYLDGGAGGVPATSPATTTFSTAATGSWLVGMAQSRNGAITAAPPMTNRSTDFGGTDGNVQYADSNGPVSTGAHSPTWTSGSGNIAALALGLIPSNSVTGGQFPPCTTNFSFDFSQLGGCNAIMAVIR